MKYKRCHLSRETERKVELGEVEDIIRTNWSVRQCLHPNAGAACTKISDAHTISRASVLRRLVDSSKQLGTFRPLKLDVMGQPILQKAGWRVASVFPGFCGFHDDLTFAPIEKVPFAATIEQCFLLGYRATCHEMTQKAASVRVNPILRKVVDRGRSHAEAMQVQGQYAAMAWGGADGLASIAAMKGRMDANLLSADFSKWEACVVEFVGELSLATTGLIAPNFDLRNRPIQVLHDRSDVMHSVSVNMVSRDRGGAVVFGWERGSLRMEQFIESLEQFPRRKLAVALAQTIFAFISNTYFSIDWWNGLDETSRHIVMEHVANTNAYYNRPILADISLVPWAITDVYRVKSP